jgi:3-hydroxyisobutyrate dehydrogenase-like beta-hydroxyacid dehydrogenase
MDEGKGSTAADETIGFIGLGQLGLPIANNLLDRGRTLRVYNRTQSKAEPLVTRGAHLAPRPVDTVTPGGVVVSVLWDDVALESVVTSDGFLERLGPGGVHVSMSTVLPETARRLAAMHEERGSLYVEAPIFGRPEAAVARQLWIPIAGAPPGKSRVRPLLEAMGAQSVFDFGDAVGAATMVKLLGNFLIVSAARSMAEVLAIADRGGVDPRAVVEMLTTTLFACPIYQGYGKRLAEGTPPMRGGIPEKDVGLLRRTAEQVGVSTPIANQLFELVRADR